MSNNEKVSIDLGGSGLRAVYTDKEGNKKSEEMPSRYLKIDIEDRVVEDLENPYEDFQIIRSVSENYKGRYVRGKACSYFDGVESIIDNSTFKVNQIATYVNAIHILALYVLKRHGAGYHKINKVGIVIPIKEFYSESATLPKIKLAGIHKVFFPVTGETVSLEIAPENIKVGGEGAVVLFNLRRNPDYKKLIEEGNGAIADVGYRSTDMAVFRNFQVDAKSCRSFPHGGITVEATLASELEKLGCPILGTSLYAVLREGKAGKYRVGKLVSKIKQMFASTLNQDLTSILAHANLTLHTLDYVVPVGRPFLVNTDTTTDTAIHTGSLKEEFIKYLPEGVKVLDCGNLETANAEALYELLG